MVACKAGSRGRATCSSLPAQPSASCQPTCQAVALLVGVLLPTSVHHVNGRLPDGVTRDAGKLAIGHAAARALQRGGQQGVAAACMRSAVQSAHALPGTWQRSTAASIARTYSKVQAPLKARAGRM